MTKNSEDDLDKIADVLLAFFKIKRISETLTMIHRFEVTGWEKWWQVELALFLSQSDEMIAEWDMEHLFDTDRRTNLAQNRMALDIGFRLKRHNKDSWYFVELKQADDYRVCIDRMCKDVDKVLSARKKSFDGLDIRFIACAGVFLEAKEKEVLDYAEEALDSINVDHQGFYFEKVGKGYNLLLF